MQRLLTSTAVALTFTALAAAPAGATTVGASGTVTLTGTVVAKCAVVGGATATSFGSSVDLGDLSGGDGRLDANLAATTASKPAGGAQAFQVLCNGAGGTITLQADPIQAVTATATTGYTNVVNYTAEVDVTLASGSVASLTNASGATAASKTLSGTDRLANTGGANVQVEAYALTTVQNALLVADNYKGQINVTISPGT